MFGTLVTFSAVPDDPFLLTMIMWASDHLTLGQLAALGQLWINLLNYFISDNSQHLPEQLQRLCNEGGSQLAKPPTFLCNILIGKKKKIKVVPSLRLQWDAEEVKYVTMSHGRSTHHVKNVLLPCRPFPGGQKWKCTFAFAFEWLALIQQCASEKRHLTSAGLGRFDRLHGTAEKRTGWKWRPSPYFTIDSRWGRVTLVRDIASKVIDFLLQFILQQPLLSLLTITVAGTLDLGVDGHICSLQCELALPNMGIENWWRPFSQVVRHQMVEGF